MNEPNAQAPQQYYVMNHSDAHRGWMDGCIVWWRAGGHGYTYDLNDAGLFTDADKEKRYPDPELCLYVPKEIVDERSYSPRLAWWSADGRKPLCQALQLPIRIEKQGRIPAPAGGAR
jgi:hypothetical protein